MKIKIKIKKLIIIFNSYQNEKKKIIIFLNFYQNENENENEKT
jgi:hypothetical protein